MIVACRKGYCEYPKVELQALLICLPCCPPPLQMRLPHFTVSLPRFFPFEPSHLPTNFFPARGARYDPPRRVCCPTEFRGGRHLEMFSLHADRLRTLHYEEEIGLSRSCSDLDVGFEGEDCAVSPSVEREEERYAGYSVHCVNSGAENYFSGPKMKT